MRATPMPLCIAAGLCIAAAAPAPAAAAGQPAGRKRAYDRRPSEEEMRKAIKQLKKLLQETPPSKYETLEARVLELGERAGFASDAGSLAGLGSVEGAVGKLHGKLGRFCLCFTVATILKKQFVDRKPAGWDALKAGSLWATGKIAGGPVAAAVGLLQYAADRSAQGLYASVDRKWFRAYAEYNLKKRPLDSYFPSFAGKTGREAIDGALAAQLDGFWDDDAYFEHLGWSVVEVKYAKEGTSARAAYREAFINRYIVPELVRQAEQAALEAEVALTLERRWREGEKHLDSIRIVVPRIIEAGIGGPTGEVVARLLDGRKEIASARVTQKDGAVLSFRADAIRGADGRLPADISLRLDPAGKAGLVRPVLHQLMLGSSKVKVLDSAAGIHLVYTFDEPVYVRLTYPVTIRVSGKLPRGCTSVGITSVPAIKERLSGGGRSYVNAIGGNGVFKCPRAPTGRCIVQLGTRVIGRMAVMGAGEHPFDAPPEESGSGPVSATAAPDLARDFPAVQKKAAELKDASGDPGAVRAELGRKVSSIAEKAAAWRLASIEVQGRLSRRRSWLGRAKISAAKRKAELAKVEAGFRKQRAAEMQLQTALQDLARRYNGLLDAIERENRRGADELEKKYNAAFGAFSEVISKAQGLMARTEAAARQVVGEGITDSLGRMSPEEAARKLGEIAALDAKASAAARGLEAAMGGLETAKAACTAAHQAWAAQCRLIGQPRGPLTWQLKTYRDLKRDYRDLKAFNAAGRSARAMSEIRRRLARRKSGEAEIVKLIGEALALARKLPTSGAAEIGRSVVYWEKHLASLMKQTGPQREQGLKYLAGEIGPVLEKYRATCGDLRRGGKRSETDYSRLAERLARIRRLLAEARAFAQANRMRMLSEIVGRDRGARALRDGPCGRAGRLEAEVSVAQVKPEAYFNPVAAAAKRVEGLIAEAERAAGADMGRALERLERAWAAAAKLPAPMAGAWRYRVTASARKVSARGALEAYARKAGRPLLVFDKAGSPFAHAILPAQRGRPSGKSFLAHLVGLRKGVRARVELWTATEARACPQVGDGRYRVQARTGDGRARIRILVAGGNVAPIDYEFLGQVEVF